VAAPELVFADGFAGALVLVLPEDWCGAELCPLDGGVTPTTLDPPVVDGTTVVGAVEGAGAGAIDRWCACLPFADADTTIFSGGGDGEPERVPVDGRCTVPESRSRAIAAAPSRSATSGTATRRAITQVPRAVPRSLADTGPSPFPNLPFPTFRQEYKKLDRTSTRVRRRDSQFPGNH
jgi:hypothetical protein